MPTNKPRFTFQISEDIAQRIETAAKAERRTTANFLAFHIEQLFSAPALLRESPPPPLAVAAPPRAGLPTAVAEPLTAARPTTTAPTKRYTIPKRTP